MFLKNNHYSFSKSSKWLGCFQKQLVLFQKPLTTLHLMYVWVQKGWLSSTSAAFFLLPGDIQSRDTHLWKQCFFCLKGTQAYYSISKEFLHSYILRPKQHRGISILVSFLLSMKIHYHVNVLPDSNPWQITENLFKTKLLQ